MKKAGLGARILAIICGIILGAAIAMYNAVNLSDAFLTPEVAMAVIMDRYVMGNYEDSSTSLTTLLAREAKQQLQDTSITDRQLAEIADSDPVRNVAARLAVSMVEEIRLKPVQGDIRIQFEQLCQQEMTGIGQKITGLSSRQEEAVINAYVKATGNAAQAILTMIQQIAEKVPFHMNFFSFIRLVSVVIGVLMVWFISLLLKNRRRWLRLRGLVTVAFALPTFITVLRMLTSGAAGLSGELGAAMKTVRFVPLTLRSAAAVFTGAVMLIMGIKLKRAENAPEYATVPVVLQEFDEGEKF